MKVDRPDHPAPARSTPAPGQFQQALQKAGAPPPPASRPPATSHPPIPLPPGKSLPRLPPPPRNATPLPRSAAPLPLTSTRSPGTAFASGPVLATARSALASPENLGLARQAMHGEAVRLRAARTESQTATREKTEHRLSELISRELARDFRDEPAPPPSAHVAPALPRSSRGSSPTENVPAAGESRLAASAAPAETSDSQLKVEATLRLIEKIELFVQSQRPALRLSLGTPLSAMVEVERTGPREVALRIQGHRGPLAQGDLTRIRDALGARGLRLRSLHAE